MEDERILSPDMVQLVEVLVLEPFLLGDRLVAVGEIVTLSRHTADYAVFLRKAAWL